MPPSSKRAESILQQRGEFAVGQHRSESSAERFVDIGCFQMFSIKAAEEQATASTAAARGGDCPSDSRVPAGVAWRRSASALAVFNSA